MRRITEGLGILVLAGALTALAAYAQGCKPAPPKPPPPPPPALLDGGLATCGTACARLLVLGCPEAGGTPADGASCEAVCEHVLSSNLVELDVSCISNAADEAAVRACPGMQHGCE